MNTRKISGILTCLAGALLASGCSSLTQPYHEKELYALNLSQAPSTQSAAATPAPAKDKSLRIRPIRVDAPYTIAELYYKTKTGTYTSDHYRSYVATPDKLLTAGLVDYIAVNGPAYPIDPSSIADEVLVLESQCTQFLGDYSGPSGPVARVAFRFQLLKPQGQSIKAVWARTYEKQIPLKADNAQALVDALSDATLQVYAQLSADLAASGEFPR